MTENYQKDEAAFAALMPVPSEDLEPDGYGQYKRLLARVTHEEGENQ